jgi:hypothetical protein
MHQQDNQILNIQAFSFVFSVGGCCSIVQGY